MTIGRSTEAYTPGPWTYHEEDNIFMVTTPAGRRVAEFQPRSIHVGEAERNANGHLIAAAPDMLEALEHILSYHRFDISDEDVDRTVAAIEKARGKA